jgi:O-antigen/teichoic acid export membrane protein
MNRFKKALSLVSPHGALLNLSATTIFVFATEALGGFVVLRWIAPDLYGVWQSLLIIQSYSVLLQAGVTNGIDRELPYRLGKEDMESARALAGSALFLTYAGAALLLAAALLVPFFLDNTLTGLSAGMVLLGSSANIVFNFSGSLFQSTRSFSVIARLNLFQAAAGLASLAAVYYYGYTGLVARFVFLRLSLAALAFALRPLKTPARISLSATLSMLKAGIPIFGFSFVLIVAMTFPKLVLLTVSGTRLVGLFAPAFACVSMFSVLATSVTQYVYPNMTRRLAQTGDPRALWPMAWRSAALTMLFSVPVVLLGLVCIPPLMHILLPNYREAVPATQWCLLAGIFTGPRIAGSALYSLKAWKWLFAHSLLFAGFFWVFPWLGTAHCTPPLTGAGMGVFAASALTCVSSMACVWLAIREKARQWRAEGAG